MLIKIAYFSTLLLYAAVISQSLFYWLAMSNVTRNMKAQAYIEARQLIDKNLQRTLANVYYAAIFSCILLIAFSVTNPGGLLFTTSILSLLALISDIFLALRYNIPINREINAWSADMYPDNWHQYRDRWLSIYQIRQVLNLLGFLALVVGYVFGH
ncbi:MAG: hypothetical protein ACK4E0_18695 [Chitinophagaceae bacterium]